MTIANEMYILGWIEYVFQMNIHRGKLLDTEREREEERERERKIEREEERERQN